MIVIIAVITTVYRAQTHFHNEQRRSFQPQSLPERFDDRVEYAGACWAGGKREPVYQYGSVMWCDNYDDDDDDDDDAGVDDDDYDDDDDGDDDDDVTSI